MPKYMLKAKYSVDGTKGLMKEGGSARRAALKKTIKGVGGALECFYFTFGETDAIAIAEVPDADTIAAVSFAINSAGAAQVSTTVLLTAEQIDEAVKKSVSYTAPGS